jgi:drug/metabolite transporter (DMT)-like permease
MTKSPQTTIKRPANGATTKTSRTWMPAFVVLAALWGSGFLLIKIIVDAGVGAVWMSVWRCLFGAVALWLIALVMRAPLPRDWKTWGHCAVVALLLTSVPFPLLAFGETRISSVLAGVWIATVPLITLVLGFLFVPEERPSARRLAGVAMGFLGVGVVLGIWRGVDAGPLIGSLACLGAATCFAGAYVYNRRFLTGSKESTTVLTAAQVTFGTLELAIMAPVVEGAPQWPGWSVTGALIVLGALGTGLPYQLNFTVIRAAGSTVASTANYLSPLFSTALGAVFLLEPVGVNTVAGAVLIILGVVLSRSGRKQDVDAVAVRAPVSALPPHPRGEADLDHITIPGKPEAALSQPES